MAHSQSTTPLASVERAVDIILKHAIHTIVGETLTQFDNGY